MQYIEHTSIFLDLSKYSKHETAPFWAILYINFFASNSFLHWIGLRLSSKNTKALSFLTQLFSFSGEITSHVCFASILTFLVFVVIVCEPRCRLRTTSVEKSVAFTLLTLLPIPTQSQSSSLQTWIGRTSMLDIACLNGQDSMVRHNHIYISLHWYSALYQSQKYFHHKSHCFWQISVIVQMK